MDLLLEHGAEVDSKGGKYGDALQAAALKAGQDFVLRLLDLQVAVNDVSGKYGTALQAAASAGDALTVALLLQHGANPQLEGGLYGNALNAAACRANIDVLNHLLEQELPYDMLNRAMLQAVLFRQDEAVNALLKKGDIVDAMDHELGSPLKLLQRPPGVDANSDFGGDEEDDDDDSDVSDDEEDDDEDGADSDEASKSGSEDDDSSVSDDTDNGASVVELQLEDPSTAESKIQKYLEDAKVRIRRNPSLRVPTAIQRKPVVKDDRIPASTAQYDLYGVSKPQQSESVGSANPTSSNEWRKNPHTPNTYPYKASTYGQAAPIAAASSEYAAYSSRPPVTQAFDSRSQRPLPGTASSNSYMANGSSQPQASPYPDQSQYDNPAQPGPPIPPKAPSYSDLSSLPSVLRPSHSSQNLSTASHLPPPPPTPPRSQATNSNYRAYAQNMQQSSPYYAYQTPHPFQTPPLQQDPPLTGAPPSVVQTPYAAYTPPRQQSQYSGQPPPPMPPRPSAAQSQSDDLLDFDRLQQKAQKFAGRFWK